MVTWTKGTDSVILPDPDEGSRNAPARNQIVLGALGGHDQTVNLDGGIARRAVDQHYELLPLVTFQAADTFLRTIVDVSGQTFTMEDWHGYTYPVRYIGDLAGDFRFTAGGEFVTGTFHFREVPA